MFLSCISCKQEEQPIPKKVVEEIPSNLNEYLKKFIKRCPIEISKINLTDDTIPDYCVLSIGDSEVMRFFDGKTKNKIPLSVNIDTDFDRSLRYNFIKINGNENYKAILFRSSYDYYSDSDFIKIAKYNPNKKEIETIFETFFFVPSKSETGKYVDITYNEKSDLDTLTVYEADRVAEGFNSLLITKTVPKNKKIKEKFIYDSKKQTFKEL